MNDDEFWNEGNLMALGAREIVKRHAAEVAALRAELTHLDIENRDRAWYVTEYAIVCKERDVLRDELAAARAGLAALGEKATRYENEREANAELVRERDAELAAVKEERDLAIRSRNWQYEAHIECKKVAWEKVEEANSLREELAAVTKMRDESIGKWKSVDDALTKVTAERDKYRESSAKAYVDAEDLRAELAALRQPGVRVPVTCPWTDDRIEALAQVLADATAEGFEESHSTYLRRLACAAVDFMRAEPPKADNRTLMEKGLLVPYTGPTRAEAEAKWVEMEYTAAFAGWLIPLLPESRTPDIGDPGPLVLVPKEPIATPETLEELAEIAGKYYAAHRTRDGVWEGLCAAILRAAQAYVDITDEKCMEEMLTIKKTQESPSSPKFRDLCNSRIRYRVAVPPVEGE